MTRLNEDTANKLNILGQEVNEKLIELTSRLTERNLEKLTIEYNKKLLQIENLAIANSSKVEKMQGEMHAIQLSNNVMVKELD